MIWRLKKIPWASLLLIALVLASYAYFGAEPYASSTAVSSLGLAWWNPFGVFTHFFMHQGVRHLLANILPLATFAVLLESTMSVGGVLVVFFAAGVAGGLVYLIVNPTALVIGASGASSGLMAAATALRPKQAITLAVLVALLSAFFITPASDFFAAQRKTQLQNEVQALGAQFEQAQARVFAAKVAVNQTAARLAEFERLGKTAEAQQTRAELARHQAELARTQEEQAKASESLESALAKKAEFARGEAQENAPVSALPHAVGALVGLVIVFAFRRADVDENLRRFKEGFASVCFRRAKRES
ncbi:MAG: rhomboid family intramembrane serine protease [Candidatus Norongarragalinales archaeon]